MIKLNLGCGISVYDGWTNYDGSPTLWLQRINLIGPLFKFIKPNFPKEVLYGNVLTKIPHRDNSVDLIYSSHMLEHLSLIDFKLEILEIYRLLKPGGVFRAVIPDLEYSIKEYIANEDPDANSKFLNETFLGIETRPKGLLEILRSNIGNSRHLWMWDFKGLFLELEKVGFINISRAFFQDSRIEDFKDVEDYDRWNNCLGFECQKPL